MRSEHLAGIQAAQVVPVGNFGALHSVIIGKPLGTVVIRKGGPAGEILADIDAAAVQAISFEGLPFGDEGLHVATDNIGSGVTVLYDG